MSVVLELTLYDYSLSDAIHPNCFIAKHMASQLFNYFNQNKLFNWQNTNNNCEARAEAICLLLQSWQIPHYKAWVFGGAFLKNHIGGLKQNWKYHVAATIPIQENNTIELYVIDPATCNQLQTIKEWASNVTAYSHSYYCIKNAECYIFSHKKITQKNWHKRNKQNNKWTIQGLAGISSLSAKGKSQLCFNKKRLKNIQLALKKLQNNNPITTINNA